ncbi:MAG: hypothetical protein RJB13_2081 [Pseudomonadota bacterium]
MSTELILKFKPKKLRKPVRFLTTVGFTSVSIVSPNAMAQEAPGAQSDDKAPITSPELMPVSPTNISALRSVAPSSLLDSRLHPATLPAEAEVRCSVQHGCWLGLSRGFAVGGNLLESLGVTTLGQHYLGAGAWHYVDTSGSYQALSQGPRKSNLNIAVGYRSFGYKNSEEVMFSRAGLTIKTAYAESVYPAYVQGLLFEIHSSVVSTDGGVEKLFDKDDSKRVRPALKQFALFSRTHPSVRLQFPADLEIANWKGESLDINAPLRSYLRVVPTYEQTDIRIGDVQSELYSWREKRFALGLLYMASYVSPEERSGKFSAAAGLGLEVGKSTVTISSNRPAQGVDPSIPKASVVRAKAELQGSYQF